MRRSNMIIFDRKGVRGVWGMNPTVVEMHS
jgi:hypothetical protein